MDGAHDHITRRVLIRRGSMLSLGALVAGAAPLARGLVIAPEALASISLPDATFQAFADTIIPGRPATRTDLGNEIHPRAIAGVDPLPGAVETDALALAQHPEIGFDALLPAFLVDVERRAVLHGSDFLSLGFDDRVAVCVGGLSFDNPLRLIWEAAAAIPFTAFCAAALIPEQTAEKASGYRVMGLPGAAPAGYADFSYGRRLARGRTRTGNLA